MVAIGMMPKEEVAELRQVLLCGVEKFCGEVSWSGHYRFWPDFVGSAKIVVV